ncbi:MAG: hypothetical protein H0V06_04090 [Gemmatimonadetes bacterium]|nr:hypothetical protein [Gemmatimonadota bacterium]MDQ3521742.1 hypothetical protein [Gemmatimonadota bacterium]
MIRPRWLILLALAFGCTRPAAGPNPAPVPNLAGQRVLVLPIQSSRTGDSASASLVAALRSAQPRAIWIGPAELQRALARLPGFAADPAALPHDPLLHHGDRRAGEPLASEIRRFSALADARWVLLPREARFVNATSRITAALLDARTGVVLWTGDAENAAGLVRHLVGPAH